MRRASSLSNEVGLPSVRYRRSLSLTSMDGWAIIQKRLFCSHISLLKSDSDWTTCARPRYDLQERLLDWPRKMWMLLARPSLNSVNHN